MDTLEYAKELLDKEGFTCVITDGERCYTSRERGVKPLLELYSLHGEQGLSGCSAADKVVGKAAAMLYVLLGVSRIHARVMSVPAARTLEANGIAFSCDTMTDAIINRAGNGYCPMETAVADTDDPKTALIAVIDRLNELKSFEK